MALAAGALLAQPAPPPAALDHQRRRCENALRNYPSIQVSQEQINAAAAGIRLARTAYLPRVDALAQVNRATRNNVFGLLLPQSAIPSMSGPVIGSNNLGTAWGSAIGTLVTWEPFDFGLRRATVAAAAAAQAQSEATAQAHPVRGCRRRRRCLSHAGRRAGDRARRPGRRGPRRDHRCAASARWSARSCVPAPIASRAEAELAAARTQLIQAQQAVDVARASVAQFVGAEPARNCDVRAAACFEPPPEESVPRRSIRPPIPSPLEQSAAVEQTKAQLKALERSYFPRFYLQGVRLRARHRRGDQRQSCSAASTAWRPACRTTRSGSP